MYSVGTETKTGPRGELDRSGVLGAVVMAQQEFEHHRRGKLGR
jgi:hypothetical protein